jgi:predicted O-methyltransferase YrrM
MDKSGNTFQQLKRLIPKPIKRSVKDALRQLAFDRAIRQLTFLPVGQLPSRQLLVDLQAGWGNESFAARTDYLEEVVTRASNTGGPILECGTGLTTILLGCLAGRRGIETWSLEHLPEWHTQMTKTLRRYGIPHTHVCFAPLHDYNGFYWYDPPLATLPKGFDLVICDGPPGTTPGNRYGLMPVLGERLAAGSLILLDDADRPGEAEVLRSWASEADLTVRLRELPTGTFAVLTHY